VVKKRNLLTAQQTASRLGIHINTLYQWIHKGIVPAHKVGILRWFIKVDDLQALLNGKGAGKVHAEPNNKESGQVAHPAPQPSERR